MGESDKINELRKAARVKLIQLISGVVLGVGAGSTPWLFENYEVVSKDEKSKIEEHKPEVNEALAELKPYLMDIHSRIDDKGNASVNNYFAILSSQQNLLVTLKLYNNLLRMVKTAEGRAFLNKEIVDIKITNKRLVSLRKQIYKDANATDKTAIMETYNKLIRIYALVIPADELEMDIKTINDHYNIESK